MQKNISTELWGEPVNCPGCGHRLADHYNTGTERRCRVQVVVYFDDACEQPKHIEHKVCPCRHMEVKP